MSQQYRHLNSCGLLVVVYRPPNSNVTTFHEELDNLISILTPKYENIFLLGDVNSIINSSDQQAITYRDVLTAHGLTNFTLEPTHEGGRSLDTVATNVATVEFLCHTGPGIFRPFLDLFLLSIKWKTTGSSLEIMSLEILNQWTRLYSFSREQSIRRCYF